MSVAAPEIPQTLQTTVCPNCAYSLAGLADAGKCPECGRVYDPSEIVLYGWGRGKHETFATAEPSRLLTVGLKKYFYMVVPLLIANSFGPLALGSVLAVVVSFLILKRPKHEHSGRVQIRLNERECVQYDDLGDPSLPREILRSYRWLIPLAAIISLTAWLITTKDSKEATLAWICLPIALVAEIAAWISCRRFRGALRQVREGSIVDVNAVYFPPAEWKDVFRASLAAESPGCYHLQVQRDGGMYGRSREGNFGEMVVDAEIRCDADQAGKIKELLGQWMADARMNTSLDEGICMNNPLRGFRL